MTRLPTIVSGTISIPSGFTTLPPARVLAADPPWQFQDKLPGNGRGAAKHYPTLSVSELMRFPLPNLADPCLLALWRVASMQQEALDVIRAWGFTLKTEIVWNKKTASGKQAMGMGRLTRGAHEVCLLATRGRFVVADRGTRSVFDAPVLGHSMKPASFYHLLERLSGEGPYVELFARAGRPGWHCYGNELPGGYVWIPPINFTR